MLQIKKAKVKRVTFRLIAFGVVKKNSLFIQMSFDYNATMYNFVNDSY